MITAYVCYSSCTWAIQNGAVMKGRDLEFYQNQPVPDDDVKELMDEEIAHVPQAPRELAQRLKDHNSTSPELSGGDIDANWEESNDDGSESFGGHNPTPDQSDVEENAHAMGIDFQDNEPLDFEKKIGQRDKNRFELDQACKGSANSI